MLVSSYWQIGMGILVPVFYTSGYVGRLYDGLPRPLIIVQLHISVVDAGGTFIATAKCCQSLDKTCSSAASAGGSVCPENKQSCGRFT